MDISAKSAACLALAAAMCLSGCSAIEDDPEWIELVNGPHNPYVHELHPVSLNSEDCILETGKKYSVNDLFVIDTEKDKVSSKLSVFWSGDVEELSDGIVIDEEDESFIIEEGEGTVIVIYTVTTPVVSYDDSCSAYYEVVEKNNEDMS